MGNENKVEVIDAKVIFKRTTNSTFNYFVGSSGLLRVAFNYSGFFVAGEECFKTNGMSMHTSVVLKIEEENENLTLHTMNSVYEFKIIEIKRGVYNVTTPDTPSFWSGYNNSYSENKKIWAKIRIIKRIIWERKDIQKSLETQLYN